MRIEWVQRRLAGEIDSDGLCAICAADARRRCALHDIGAINFVRHMPTRIHIKPKINRVGTRTRPVNM